MIRIDRPELLREFARTAQMRCDWHEPDEVNISARVEGVSFDNAGFWPAEPGLPERITELHVIFFVTTEDPDGITRRSKDLACVNVATLCAWATGYTGQG